MRWTASAPRWHLPPLAPDQARGAGEQLRAITLEPDQFLVFYNRGVACERTGDFAHALSDLNEAVRLNPTDAQSYAVRGGILIRSGKPDAARTDFTSALKIDPANQFASRGLSTLSGNHAGESIAEPEIGTQPIRESKPEL